LKRGRNRLALWTLRLLDDALAFLAFMGYRPSWYTPWWAREDTNACR